MVETPVDVLIIGGGITGAGIARDAALRGFRTALVDKSDFGAGTSSHSSRLIHGGIRYLEQRAFHLVFEASRERRVLLTIAPHLVRPLAFLFPVYRGGRIPAWKLRAGMWLYDLLSVFRNVHWHRWLRAKKVRRVEPALRDRGLVGAALYYDAQTDDARLVIAKGAHVTVPRRRMGNEHAVTLLSQIDGRVMFVLPWGELSYIGTTDTDADGSPDALRVTAADVTYLLRSANAAFPDAHLGSTDVISAWSGLRPLLREDHANPSQVSREHRVLESPHGLISIAGGKLTTYRVMARDVVDRVATRLHELDGRPAPARARTDRLPLPGGEAAELEVLVEAARARGAAEATARHLVAYYGSEAAAVLNLVDRERPLGEPIIAGRPEIWAEVSYAVERELAVRVQDILIRRLHLFYELADQARSVVPRVAARMKQLLGWDDVTEAEELRDYFQIVERSRIKA